MVAKAPRHYWMDLLNVIACFAVVMLHCTTTVFANSGDTEWHLDVLFQSICIFAVPVFFMISGANLLGYREKYDTKTFFVKRFRKVVFTLVIASIIVYVCQPLLAFIIAGTPLDISIGGFMKGFLHNQICDIYWFFYAIIILYAVTPVFSLVAQNKQVLGYAICLCIATTMVFPLLERFSPDGGFLSLFMVPYLSSWLTYFLLGYYLVHYCDKKPAAWKSALVAVVCVAIMVVMTVKTNAPHTLAAGSFAPYDNFYASATGLFALVYAVALFFLFGHFNDAIGSAKAYPFINKMSGLSLGVYAMHMMVIHTLDLVVPHSIVWNIGLRPFVVFALALALSFIGKQFMAFTRKLRAK